MLRAPAPLAIILAFYNFFKSLPARSPYNDFYGEPEAPATVKGGNSNAAN